MGFGNYLAAIQSTLRDSANHYTWVIASFIGYQNRSSQCYNRIFIIAIGNYCGNCGTKIIFIPICQQT